MFSLGIICFRLLLYLEKFLFCSDLNIKVLVIFLDLFILVFMRGLVLGFGLGDVVFLVLVFLSVFFFCGGVV